MFQPLGHQNYGSCPIKLFNQGQPCATTYTSWPYTMCEREMKTLSENLRQKRQLRGPLCIKHSRTSAMQWRLGGLNPLRFTLALPVAPVEHRWRRAKPWEAGGGSLLLHYWLLKVGVHDQWGMELWGIVYSCAHHSCMPSQWDSSLSSEKKRLAEIQGCLHTAKMI